MSEAETFFLGVAGAFTAFVSVVVLPELNLLLDGEAKIEKRRIIVSLIMAVFFLGIGGLVAWVLGDATQPKRVAFFYGAGWQALTSGTGAAIGIIGRQLEESPRRTSDYSSSA